MKLLLILLSSCMFAIQAQAATIRQILNDQSLAIVEIKSSEKVEAGDHFIASDSSNQCLLEILSIDAKLATVSSKNCSNKDMLKVGKSVEKSLFAQSILIEKKLEPTPEAPKTDVPPQPQPQSSGHVAREDNYGALVVSYVINPKILIEITASNGTASEKADVQYNFTNATAIGFEWSTFAKNSWNHGALLELTSLKFDSFTISGSSGSASGTMDGGMTLMKFAYNLKYRLENFYFPIGLGYTSSTVDSDGSFTKTIGTRFFTGFGVGFAISDSFNFEFTTNATSITSSTVSLNGVTFTPDEKLGYLTNLQLTGKFLFR